MPLPISVRPARPGDGSGICGPTRAERERRERQEAKEEAEHARVEAYMEDAYPSDAELAEREPERARREPDGD